MILNGVVALRFVREKETLNTMRYKEAPLPGEPAVVGSMYLRKDAYEALGEPVVLSVMIEAAGAAE